MKNKPKKIIVDCLPLTTQFTGIAKYIDENLSILTNNPNHQWYFIYPGEILENLYRYPDLPIKSQRVQSLKKIAKLTSLLERPARWIFNKIQAIMVKQAKIQYDLYWQPSYIIENSIEAKKIVATVHDFSFCEHPEWHPKARLDSFNQNFFQNITKADLIICDSHYIKNEIVNRIDIDEEHVKVIYLGIDHQNYRPYSVNELQTIQTKFDLPKQFILFVGSIEPRKNLKALLLAYLELPIETKKQTPLVLVGFKGWENRKIMQLIEQQKEFIQYLGYLSDYELACVYNLATIFIYPSLYEGFGIPPLEAMACGCPVIVSNVTSLPEVCGDAAIYIDPLDTQQITANIQSLLEDQKLQQEYHEKGRNHVKQFNWQESADQHMQIFNKLLTEL